MQSTRRMAQKLKPDSLRVSSPPLDSFLGGCTPHVDVIRQELLVLWIRHGHDNTGSLVQGQVLGHTK